MRRGIVAGRLENGIWVRQSRSPSVGVSRYPVIMGHGGAAEKRGRYKGIQRGVER